MVKKAVGILNKMAAAVVPGKKQQPVKKQEMRLCPHCGHSMAKTRTFCSHCQQFKNGYSELIRPVQGQFHH